MNKKRSLTLTRSIAFLATAVACSTAANASTSFNFTGNGGSNLGNSVIAQSDDGLITATITASRHGNSSGVSGFALDGYGVADGGYRSIQGNETLHISFSQAVNIDTLHLRQWEGPDDAVAVISYNGGSSSSQTITADTGGAFDTNEYIALNAVGVTSLDISGIYNGNIFFVEATQFFVAGLQGVTVTPSEVPVPAAAWLFGSALLGLSQLKRLKK